MVGVVGLVETGREVQKKRSAKVREQMIGKEGERFYTVEKKLLIE